MTENDKPKFSEILMGFGELFDKQLTPALTSIYWNALKQYPLEDIEKAANHIVQTHKYATFPKPAEFIEFIIPPQQAADCATLACNEVFDMIEREGSVSNVFFDDPVIHVVIKEHYGGWVKIATQIPGDEKEHRFWAREFERVYKIYARQPLPKEIPLLLGTIAMANIEKGYLTDAQGYAIKGENDNWIKLGTPEAQKLIEQTKKTVQKRIGS